MPNPCMSYPSNPLVPRSLGGLLIQRSFTYIQRSVQIHVQFQVPGTRTDIISGSSSSNQHPPAHPLATPSSATVQYVQYTEYWMYLLYFVQQRVSNTKSENQPPSRTRLGPTTAPSQMAHDDLARPLTSQCIWIQSPSSAYWVWFSLLQTTFRDTAGDTTEIQVFTLILVSHCIHTHSG